MVALEKQSGMIKAVWMQQAIRLALFAATIIFITLLFPRQLSLDFQVKPGQAWKLEALTAPFDFAIRKTAGELRVEQEALTAEFPPCYRKDTGVAGRQLTAFEADFRDQLTTLPASGNFADVVRQPRTYLEYGKAILTRRFQQGIIQLDDAHRDKGKALVINLLEKNATRQITADQLLPLSEARMLLIDSLPLSPLPEPDFLLPLLERHLVPNITFDSTTTAKFLTDALAGISAYRGMVKKGDLIIAQQELITQETILKLSSMREQYRAENQHAYASWGMDAGYWVLITMLMVIFYVYLLSRDPQILKHVPSLIFVLSTLALYCWLVYWAEKTNPINAYFIPFGIAPILLQTFFNKRFALFTHIILLSIISFISSLGWNFILLQIVSGIVILLTDVNVENWTKFFRSIFFMLASGVLVMIGLTLIATGTLVSVDTNILVWLFLSAFLTLLALPLVPLLERIFGFTSVIRLRELMDLNRPLLKELAQKAPGTLQHAIQVGHLSEAAAIAIGADALLVRVAALYHDIGKLVNPEYFIENQSALQSPHQQKSYLESAQLIIGHVHEGLSLAKKHKLPEVIRAFIATHHGTTRVEYFYRKMMNERVTDDTPPEMDFRYPGPLPNSKEQTIMMLADSIEAACRSIRQPGEQQIYALIDDIIHSKIDMGQLEQSALSFHELELCSGAFKKIMKSVHHQRIAYPPAAD